MKIRLLIASLFLSLGSFAQVSLSYNTELIPSALRNRANAIIRNEETVVDMRAYDNVIQTVKKAITVLNKNGDDDARLVLFYNKNISIKSIKGEIYDEFGLQTGKFSQGDFKDESAVAGFSLFEDSRIKHYLPAVNNYPYTIVYTYEIRSKQNLVIPDWMPKRYNGIAVEKSSYAIICKPDDKLIIKTQSITSKPEENSAKDQKMMVWRVNNLPATKYEPYSPNSDEYLPSVKVASQQFSYYNYRGSYSNWDELGKWTYNNLLKGRSEIPPLTADAILSLVKDSKDDKEKARRIYQFLQNKTRYISVQIGIGGLQPITASEVDRVGYGDCKALVNYMQGLLKVVGIESYYCMVEAGNEKVSFDPAFASMNQGNHVILCMPLKGDTTWLECTSQKIPFGYLSNFTDDRYVLACTPEGGKLLRTPKLTTKNNSQIRTAEFTMASDGSLTGNVRTIFSGAQYENRDELIDKPFSEQQKLLKGEYDIDNIDFEKISYTQKKDIEPVLTEDIKLSISNYGTINNGRIFFLPNAFNVRTSVAETKNRTLPVYINRGYTDEDHLVYILPENVIPLIKPEDKSVKTEFGFYSTKVMIEGTKLIYDRKFVLNDGTFPAGSYEAFCKFINDVRDDDMRKLVLNLKK